MGVFDTIDKGVLTHGDDMLIGFHYAYNTDSGIKTTKTLNEKRYSASKHANSRLLNHWEKELLLDDNRENNKGWRVYSAIEVIWINIIIEIRKFNFSLDKIVALKKSLELHSDEIKISKMPLLEMYVRYVLSNVKPFYLIVREGGQGSVGFRNEVELHKELGFVGNHICINLNDIMKRVFPNANLELEFKVDWKLNEAEEDLIRLIRSGEFKEIEIKTREGNINTIDALELIKEQSRFREIANNYDFQDITSKYREGRLVAIERKVKKKY